MPAHRAVRTATLVPALVLLAGVVGCSSDKADQTVAVDYTAGECTLARTEIPAGTTEFAINNDSGSEAEGYVYTADGDVVDEVEHIADGTARSVTVTLEAGDYEFACKGGGDDVRTPFTVQ
jgi:iron uptake system component EfeO